MKGISLKSYELMADDYAGYVDEKPWNADYERPGTLSLLGSVDGLDILDAGCAAGWYSKTMLDMGAKRVIGLDFSPAMIERSKLRVKDYAKERYDFYCHDLNEEIKNLRDKSFHKVVTSLTLHYLEDWRIPLGEFHRVLKAEGELIISIHHPFREYLVFNKENYFKKELTQDMWSMNGREVEVEFYTRPLHEIVNSIIEGGFQIKRLEEPMPTDDFRRKDLKNYIKLTKRPQFLFIKAVKV